MYPGFEIFFLTTIQQPSSMRRCSQNLHQAQAFEIITEKGGDHGRKAMGARCRCLSESAHNHTSNGVFVLW